MEVPNGVQGQVMETLEKTNRAVTKIDLRWWGACTHVPPLATPLDPTISVVQYLLNTRIPWCLTLWEMLADMLWNLFRFWKSTWNLQNLLEIVLTVFHCLSLMLMLFCI